MKIKQEDEDWLDRCMRCIHCYTPVNDADEIRCRCRNGCNFKEYKKRGVKRNDRPYKENRMETAKW